MVCHNCQLKAVKAGKDRKGNQRYRCDRCKRRFQAEREKLFGNMYTPRSQKYKRKYNQIDNRCNLGFNSYFGTLVYTYPRLFGQSLNEALAQNT